VLVDSADNSLGSNDELSTVQYGGGPNMKLADLDFMIYEIDLSATPDAPFCLLIDSIYIGLTPK
jgi:hypothetical protein